MYKMNLFESLRPYQAFLLLRSSKACHELLKRYEQDKRYAESYTQSQRLIFQLRLYRSLALKEILPYRHILSVLDAMPEKDVVRLVNRHATKYVKFHAKYPTFFDYYHKGLRKEPSSNDLKNLLDIHTVYLTNGWIHEDFDTQEGEQAPKLEELTSWYSNYLQQRLFFASTEKTLCLDPQYQKIVQGTLSAGIEFNTATLEDVARGENVTKALALVNGIRLLTDTTDFQLEYAAKIPSDFADKLMAFNMYLGHKEEMFRSLGALAEQQKQYKNKVSSMRNIPSVLANPASDLDELFKETQNPSMLLIDSNGIDKTAMDITNNVELGANFFWGLVLYLENQKKNQAIRYVEELDDCIRKMQSAFDAQLARLEAVKQKPDIDPRDKMIADLTKTINMMQVKLDKFEVSSKDLKVELSYYKEQVSHEKDTVHLSEEATEQNPVPDSYPDGTILIGGHPIWQKHFHERYPNVEIIDGNSRNINLNKFNENTPLVLINFKHMSHATYYRFMPRIKKLNIQTLYVC